MRKTLYILMAALCLSSCAKDSILPASQTLTGSNDLNITVKAQDLVETKAEMPGVQQDLHENSINSLYYFVYTRESAQQSAPSGKAVKWGPVSVLPGTTNEYTLKINLTDEEISEKVFKYSTSCFVYVVANLAEEILAIDSEDDTDFATLTRKVITGSFTANEAQESFVMEGYDIVNKIANPTDKVIAGGDNTIIKIDRLATKTTIDMTVENTVQVKDEDGNILYSWEPVYETMTIQLRNGVTNARLDGDYLSNAERFDRTTARSFTGPVNDKYTTAIPFYTYPMKWTPGSQEEPYLFIMIQWKKSTDGSLVNTYYKLLLAGTEYAQNTWHHINLNIGTLGSLDPETPDVTIEQTYNVANWRSGNPIETNIKYARYLVVPSNTYTIDNKNELTIATTSSHNIEVVDLRITRPVYSSAVTTTETIFPSDTEREISEQEYVTIDGLNIIVHKDLIKQAQGVKDYDITPITYTFTVAHTDSPNIKEEITVTQYPAIYIIARANHGGEDPTTSASKRIDGGLGYVYINGVHSSSTSTTWVKASGGTGDNANGNMYIINTTALDQSIKCSDTNPYIIGDPRETANSTLTDASGFPALDSKNERLPYTTIGGTRYYSYHKTITTDEVEHFIAPSFRIASSYGKSQRISKNNAERRCAAYQEDGYPAGRWRLPTYAEFNYIAQLSNDEKIPQLFNNDGYYWTAQGVCQYSTDGTIKKSYGTTSAFARCVYDDWYWGRDRDDRTKNGNVYTKFIWGNE